MAYLCGFLTIPARKKIAFFPNVRKFGLAIGFNLCYFGSAKRFQPIIPERIKTKLRAQTIGNLPAAKPTIPERIKTKLKAQTVGCHQE